MKREWAAIMENVLAPSGAPSVSASYKPGSCKGHIPGLTKQVLPKLSSHITRDGRQNHGRRLPERHKSCIFCQHESTDRVRIPGRFPDCFTWKKRKEQSSCQSHPSQLIAFCLWWVRQGRPWEPNSHHPRTTITCFPSF